MRLLPYWVCRQHACFWAQESHFIRVPLVSTGGVWDHDPGFLYTGKLKAGRPATSWIRTWLWCSPGASQQSADHHPVQVPDLANNRGLSANGHPTGPGWRPCCGANLATRLIEGTVGKGHKNLAFFCITFLWLVSL